MSASTLILILYLNFRNILTLQYFYQFLKTKQKTNALIYDYFCNLTYIFFVEVLSANVMLLIDFNIRKLL